MSVGFHIGVGMRERAREAELEYRGGSGKPAAQRQLDINQIIARVGRIIMG